MILVTGATGTVGTEVVRILAERGERVRAMTRNPDGVRLPVEVVRGDFDDPASLDAAVAGAGAVFLLDAPGASIERHDLALIAAVRAHGGGRVVKVSAIGTGEDTAPRTGAWHLPGERALRAGDAGAAAWTILRPSSFASNTLQWAPSIRTGQAIANLTGTGAQGVVDPRDVAEVAVAALTGPGHAGRTYTLTGPELLSAPDQVEILRKTLGVPVEIADVPLDVARERMIAAGHDPEFTEGAMRGQRFIAEGGNARLTDDVADVLGRPARTYATWAADHRAAFTG